MFVQKYSLHPFHRDAFYLLPSDKTASASAGGLAQVRMVAPVFPFKACIYASKLNDVVVLKLA